MVVIDQSAELIRQDGNPYELIEQVARTCYKSEPQGDAKAFVLRLRKAHHEAMLEHAYVYFIMDNTTMRCFLRLNNTKIKYMNVAENYISGSFRAWLEFFEKQLEDCGNEADEMGAVNKVLYKQLHDKYPDLFTEYVGDSTNGCDAQLVSRQEFIDDVVGRFDGKGDWILKRLLPHTVRFITTRAVSHELVRHRPASYGEMSQRYVDFSKDKYGGMKFIRPMLSATDILSWEHWNYAMIYAETNYMNLRKNGIQPQIARGVLPNDCATEICITATEEEWQHIINLRYHGTTGVPHPQMKQLMGLIYPTLLEESNNRIS